MRILIVGVQIPANIPIDTVSIPWLVLNFPVVIPQGILRHDLDDEPYTTLVAVSTKWHRDGLGVALR